MRRQRLRLGIAGDTLSYAIKLGYRADDVTSAFVLDPEIQLEWIWAGGPFHPRSLLVQRTGAVVERCGDGRSMPMALEAPPHDSLFTAVSDPLEAPEEFQPGLLRPLEAAELSDGTQISVVAHAEALIAALQASPGCRLLRLERAAWRWPA